MTNFPEAWLEIASLRSNHVFRQGYLLLWLTVIGVPATAVWTRYYEKKFAPKQKVFGT